MEEVKISFQNGNYEKALNLVDSLLNTDSSNSRLGIIRLACLVALGQFEQLCDSSNSSDSKSLEYSIYALYKLNKFKEAAELFDKARKVSGNGVNLGLDLLEAQIAYKLDNFPLAISLYSALIDKTDPQSSFYTELAVNYQACLVGGLMSQKKVGNEKSINAQSFGTFEYLYNSACVDIAKNRLEEASQKLTSALNLCSKTMKEDGYSADEIQAEIFAIEAQQAYLVALSAPSSASHKLKQLIESKNSDFSVRLSCLNNLLVVSQDGDIEELMKKYKWHSLATGNSIKYKLNGWNEARIRSNYALILKRQRKSSQARHHLKRALKVCPVDELALVLKCQNLVQSTFSKKRPVSDASLEKIKTLRDELNAPILDLVLVDLLVKRKEYKNAISIIDSMKQGNSASIVQSVREILSKLLSE